MTDEWAPGTDRKTCVSASLSTTNATLIDQVSSLGLDGERPATIHVYHASTSKCLC